MLNATPTNYHVQTSVESRDAMDGSHKSNRWKQIIFENVCLSGTHGMTCDEIEVKLGVRHQTASCFISVLKASGAIVATGATRPARSGRNVTVYTRKFNGIPRTESSELFNVKPTFRKEF